MKTDIEIPKDIKRQQCLNGWSTRNAKLAALSSEQLLAQKLKKSAQQKRVMRERSPQAMQQMALNCKKTKAARQLSQSFTSQES